MTEQATTTEKPKRTRKAKAGKTAEPTEYVVLESLPANEGENGVKYMNGDDIEGAEVWLAVGRLTARGGNEGTLLRKWGEKAKRTGTFKLVPARSWAGGIRLFEQTSMASEPLA